MNALYSPQRRLPSRYVSRRHDDPSVPPDLVRRVKTRIQADSANGRSVRALLKRILQEEGITGFYRGFGATMLNTFSMRTSFFSPPFPFLSLPPNQTSHNRIRLFLLLLPRPHVVLEAPRRTAARRLARRTALDHRRARTGRGGR